MFDQIAFDLKKNVRSSTNLILFVAFLILLLGSFFSALGTTDLSRMQLTQAYSSANVAIDGQIKALSKLKHPTAAQKATLARKQDQVHLVRNIVMGNAGLVSPVPTGSINDLNRPLLAYAKYNLRETEAGHAADLTLIRNPGDPLDPSLIGRKKEVRFYQYLVAHHIAELPATKANAPAAAYLPFQFLYHLSPLIILGLFVIELGQLFTTEKHDGTIDFMNNLPTGKLKLLVARMITFLALSLPNFASACLVTYLTAGLTFGWGSWRYPLVYSGDGRTAQIMTLGHFFALLCLMLVAAVLFLMMLSALLSLLSGNIGINVIGGLAVLVLATKEALSSGILSPLAKFLPVGYFDFTKVILHQTGWPIFSISAGIGIILGWALVLFGVCVVIVRRRQRL